MLTEVLKEIKDADESGLLGTGFDEAALAALVMVSRTSAEIKDFDEAAEWVGMPDYEEGKRLPKLVILFDSEEDREAFFTTLGARPTKVSNGVCSMRWPPAGLHDWKSIRFEGQ
jgi:hypothetical protein